MRTAPSFQPIFAFDDRNVAAPVRKPEAMAFDGWSYQPIPIGLDRPVSASNRRSGDE